MKSVVISAETIDSGLLGCCLVFYDPVRLAVFWNVLGRRRACNTLCELLTGSFRAEIKRGALTEGRITSIGLRSHINGTSCTYVELGVWHTLRVNQERLALQDNPRLFETGRERA